MSGVNRMGLLRIFHALLPVKNFSKPAQLFLIATIIDGIIYSAWSLFFNFFILAEGYNKDFLGLVNSLPSIAALLFGIPLGMLSDRIGRRRAMLLGLVINTAGMGLQVMSKGPTLLMVMVFMGGLGQNLYYVSQAPFMMSTSSAANRSLLFSLNYGLITLSGAVGSLFAGQMPGLFGQIFHLQANSSTAYQVVLLCSVALGALSLLPIYLIHEERTGASLVKSGDLQIGRLLARPILWKLVLPNLSIGMGAAILMPYMNLFFVEKFQFSDQVLGGLFSLSALFTGIGCVLGPTLAVHWKSKIRIVVITQGLSLIFLVLLGFTTFGWLAGISYLARSTFMNMAAPLYGAFSMEQFDPKDQGAANSVLNISWTLGWGVGPYISGIVQQHYGFQPLFITTTLLYALAATLIWIYFHRSERNGLPAVQENLELELSN
jgi:MFS family permease